MSEQHYMRFAAVNIGERGATGLRIKNLRMVFSCEKTLSSEPNTASVTIYDLCAEHRQMIKERGKFLELEVAYGDEKNLTQLFTGDTSFISHRKDPVDWQTVIECGDGLRALKETNLSMSYGPGVDLDTILDDMVDTMGDRLSGAASDFKEKFKTSYKQTGSFWTAFKEAGKKFLKGFSFSGKPKQLMDQLSRQMGVEISVQNDVLEVVSIDDFLNRPLISLSPESGLIGSPTITEDGGVNFTAQLEPKIIPGTPVLLKSKIFEGIVKPTRCYFSGDTHGGEWSVYCEGRPMSYSGPIEPVEGEAK